MRKPKTVLVVDDSGAIREAVSFMLKSYGFDVLKANDGTDSLKYLTGSPIDLVITDLHMPNMDGIGLIKEIRKKQDYQRTPILVLTTESQATKKLEAKQAGATGWIVKPFESSRLLSIIKKVLR